MTKTENRKKAVGIGIKPLGAGIALGVIVITLMLFLGSLLISGEKVPESFSEVIILQFAEIASIYIRFPKISVYLCLNSSNLCCSIASLMRSISLL